MSKRQNPSLMLHEVWGKIDNHQIKTDLQPPSLPRPLPPSPSRQPAGPEVCYSWLDSRLLMKHLYEAWALARALSIGTGLLEFSTGPPGLSKTIQASALLLLWTPRSFPSTTQHLILSRHAGGQMALANVN